MVLSVRSSSCAQVVRPRNAAALEAAAAVTAAMKVGMTLAATHTPAGKETLAALVAAAAGKETLAAMAAAAVLAGELAAIAAVMALGTAVRMATVACASLVSQVATPS